MTTSPTTEPTLADLFGPIIHSYSRAQALADGALVAVPQALGREAGHPFPVALTAAAWADCVAWSEATEARKPHATGQDETGRLWDVLYMARRAAGAAAHNGGGNRVAFQLVRVPATGRGLRPRLTELVLMLGPGDDGQPVATIGLPTED